MDIEWSLPMRALDAHGKLLTLLCLLLVASGGLLLPGSGGLLAAAQAQGQPHDQAVQAFDQIVPNMTRADDLPNLGFDAKAEILSYLGIQSRFLPAAGMRREHLDPAVQACIRAEVYCTGYVFHPGQADVTLLVMNGRVIHKVISMRSPQGGAVARVSANTASF